MSSVIPSAPMSFLLEISILIFASFICPVYLICLFSSLCVSVHVCMHLCVCVWFMHVYLCVWWCMHMCAYVYMGMRVRSWTCVHMYKSECMCCLCMCAKVCRFLGKPVCTCVYVCMQVYSWLHVNVHVSMGMWVFVSLCMCVCLRTEANKFYFETVVLASAATQVICGVRFPIPAAVSQLETLAPQPVFLSSCPFVPSSQLASLCGFLFLFAKSNVFLNQIMYDKQSSRFSLVPVMNKAPACSLSPVPRRMLVLSFAITWFL